jgi:hypothetical protein
VLHFISSTFEDTQFEQDYLLTQCFPFLKEFCDELLLDFNVVSMRWGVRARAGNDHRTAELCMEELQQCLQKSAGLAYIAIQSYRYGFQPFPRIICSDEFDAIKEVLLDKDEDDITHLECPYWKLNTSIVPWCYELQPIASLPELEDYLISDEDNRRMRVDDKYKSSRLAARSQASAKWWSIFENIQSLLRKGVVMLSDEQQSELHKGPGHIWEKYFISVTHDEVNRGLLHNASSCSQAIYIERIIENIEKSSTIDSRQAPRFRDADSNDIDPRGVAALHRKLKEQIRQNLPQEKCFEYCVPFIGNGKLSKEQPTAPVEWQAQLEDFGKFFIQSSCQTILMNYKAPPPPIALEMMRQHMAVHKHIQESGFDRVAEIALVVNYCTSFAPPPESPSTSVNLEHVTMLQSIGGWTKQQCINALSWTDGGLDDALLLLSEGAVTEDSCNSDDENNDNVCDDDSDSNNDNDSDSDNDNDSENDSNNDSNNDIDNDSDNDNDSDSNSNGDNDNDSENDSNNDSNNDSDNDSDNDNDSDSNSNGDNDNDSDNDSGSSNDNEAPDDTYFPLFLHGKSGSGKR